MVPKLSQAEIRESNIGCVCSEFQVNRGFGGKIAVRFLDAELRVTDLTYQDLNFRSNQVANLLHAGGFTIGEKAFIYLPKCVEIYEIFLGILKAGLIAGTLFSSFGPEALFDRLSDSGASVVFTKKKMAAKLMRVKDQLPNLREIILIDSDDNLELCQKDYHQLLSKMTTDFSCSVFGQKPAYSTTHQAQQANPRECCMYTMPSNLNCRALKKSSNRLMMTFTGAQLIRPGSQAHPME